MVCLLNLHHPIVPRDLFCNIHVYEYSNTRYFMQWVYLLYRNTRMTMIVEFNLSTKIMHTKKENKD